MFLAFCSFMIIGFTWPENTALEIKKRNICSSLAQGFRLLGNAKILLLGIIDSSYNCCIQVFIFIWTPLLQRTSGQLDINPGIIFIGMLIITLSHNKLLECLNILYWPLNYFHTIFYYAGFYCICYFCVFYIDSYMMRVIFLSFINGSSGLVAPVMSYLKSIILIEKSRALLMNIYMIPMNSLLAVMLVLAGYLNDPVRICSFAWILSCCMVAGSGFLLMRHLKENKEKDPNGNDHELSSKEV